MPVRIYFRGLILFRFPVVEGAVRLQAELISEPPNRDWKDLKDKGAVQGQDDHEATIQVISGDNVRELLPYGLVHKSRIDLVIPRGPDRRDGVTRHDNFGQYVPHIESLAKLANLPKQGEDDDYLRATVWVNRGRIRVNEVVVWDTGAESLPRRRARENEPVPAAPLSGFPATPAHVKFCGVAVDGHAANECVLEVDDTDLVDITSADLPEMHPHRLYRSTRRRNQLAPEGTTEILITNFEYQRARPVPWGLDFQWLFARLGYGTTDLETSGGDARTFRLFAEEYDKELFQQDQASTLPDTTGRPFPYILSDQLLQLTPIHPKGSIATGTQSRPLCIGGH